MNKPKIFTVTKTPKGLDNILSMKPELALQYYCAVINVSDSPCATFDYQKAGVPSFWFPINEIAQWTHAPFYGTLRVVNEYFKNDGRSVLIHCHAGANRSPSVAFAVLLAKGYTPEEAEQQLNYDNLKEVFMRNIERKHIPDNIVEFLRIVDGSSDTDSIASALRKISALYDEWAQKKFDEQNDYTLKGDPNSTTRLVYNKETKRFVLVKDTPQAKGTPWIDPQYKREEWYITPVKQPPEK